jgi:hypothetical protein
MTGAAPETIEELIAHGWELAADTLAHAQSERELVTHWFITPEDSAVNSDEHFGSNERTVTFVRLVLPTLADQLDASHMLTAVPWDVDDQPALLVLIAALHGEDAVIEARPITRVERNENAAPPWWSMAPETADPPVELIEEVALLSI